MLTRYLLLLRLFGQQPKVVVTPHMHVKIHAAIGDFSLTRLYNNNKDGFWWSCNTCRGVRIGKFFEDLARTNLGHYLSICVYLELTMKLEASSIELRKESCCRASGTIRQA